jgi:amino acid transporter
MSSDPEYDAEKNVNLGSSSPEWDSGDAAPSGNWRTRFVDSFRRDPNAAIIKPGQAQAGNPRGFDHKGAAQRTANSGLAHKLKNRHMQMIAIGGAIGSSRTLTSDAVIRL